MKIPVLRVLIVALAALLSAGVSSRAATERVIHAFKTGQISGPASDLIYFDGMLYGTTQDASGGAVFSMTRGGTTAVLHKFHGGPADGGYPVGGLTAMNGTLYGATTYGGIESLGIQPQGAGFGLIYSLTSGGTFKVLYDFTGTDVSDTAYPDGGLVRIGRTLYGASVDGGIFAVTPSGAEHVLYGFCYQAVCPGGSYPYGNLIAANGMLYGVTVYGGAQEKGTVYAMTPSGKLTVLYSFKGGSDGANPQTGLTMVDGTLYGTTPAGGSSNCQGGCGTVFAVTLAGVESVVYAFKGGSDGAVPRANLIDVNGTLYGVTSNGGSTKCQGGCGVVFAVTPGGAETIVHAFAGGKDGADPVAGLLDIRGTLYGTTFAGGGGERYCQGGCGTVFAIIP
jgi:uncharacterized repeat protein (TIGR03803 family)